MAHLTWANDTGVNPTNLNKMTQEDDLKPTASTFNGQTGRTLTHNYGHTDYEIIINPTANPQGFLGEVWTIKSANTVVVYNSGSHTGAFEYVIVPHA